MIQEKSEHIVYRLIFNGDYHYIGITKVGLQQRLRAHYTEPVSPAMALFLSNTDPKDIEKVVIASGLNKQDAQHIEQDEISKAFKEIGPKHILNRYRGGRRLKDTLGASINETQKDRRVKSWTTYGDQPGDLPPIEHPNDYTPVCANCRVAKPLKDFPKEPRKASGHYSWCTECKRIADRERCDRRVAINKAKYPNGMSDYRPNEKYCGACLIRKPKEAFYWDPRRSNPLVLRCRDCRKEGKPQYPAPKGYRHMIDYIDTCEKQEELNGFNPIENYKKQIDDMLTLATLPNAKRRETTTTINSVNRTNKAKHSPTTPRNGIYSKENVKRLRATQNGTTGDTGRSANNRLMPTTVEHRYYGSIEYDITYPRVPDDTLVTCKNCGKEQEAKHHYTHSQYTNGLNPNCKICQTAIQAVKRGKQPRVPNGYGMASKMIEKKRKPAIKTHPIIDGRRLCYKCDSDKPITEYYIDRRRPDGYSGYCKACSSAICKEKYKGKPRQERIGDDYIVCCPKCDTNKPAREFTSDRRRLLGIFSWCRACVSESKKDYYKRNKQKYYYKGYKRTKYPPLDGDKTMICRRCHEVKLAVEFYKHKNNRTGRDHTCKECRKALNKEREDRKLQEHAELTT